jgi:hypothetical protein
VGYFLPLLRSFPARRTTELRLQPTKPRFDLRVGTRFRPPVRLEIILRIGVALMGNLSLIALFGTPSIWSGRERALWSVFLFATVACISIVIAVPVMLQGKAEEKVVGIILSMWPSFCLLAVAWSVWHHLR